MLRVSKRTIYYWIAKGRFPRSDVDLGSQLRAWRAETVAAWLESRTVDPAWSGTRGDVRARPDRRTSRQQRF